MYVVGIEKVNYENKQGRTVNGTRLHMTYDNNRVDGSAVDCVFVGDRVEMPDIQLGDEINIFYNRYGSVESIMKV